jgi:hypothetical protein
MSKYVVGSVISASLCIVAMSASQAAAVVPPPPCPPGTEWDQIQGICIPIGTNEKDW